MQDRNRGLAIALALGIAFAGTAAAQGTAIKIKEEKPGLLKQAKVAPADAQRTAQAKFPAGKILSGEIEQEDGKLIFSFDIKQRGVKGIEEVNVDAVTGAVVAVEHENPKDEAKEKAKEKANGKTKSPTKPSV